MRHQKQPYCGCFPVTMAMLYNVKVDEVVKVGLEGTSWTTWDKAFHLAKDNKVYYDIVKHILLKFPGPLALAYNTSIPHNPLQFPWQLPPNKGAITITNGPGNHVVAYENQMIFDGNMTTSIPWDMWKDYRIEFNWTLTSIIEMDNILNNSRQLKLDLRV